MHRLLFVIVFCFAAMIGLGQGLPCDHPDRIQLNVSAPDVFTPNGDGVNDLFRAQYNIDAFDHFEMFIYNRAGQLLFYADRPAHGWDGRTATGTNCPEGTYFCVIKYSSPCESDKLAAVLELLR